MEYRQDIIQAEQRYAEICRQRQLRRDDLYTLLLNKCDGVDDIPNHIFKLLNINRASQRLSFGTVSMQILKDRKSALRNQDQ